ncbi:SUKH-4 family immunity protein [Kitasatospora sp. NPDC002227]|uniref:SUKH-4 family immunity protein n=1 Tax=Kitasatospora sp. NPDC002227 TaxID=3154773 RepID=UPI00332574AE
MLVTADWPGIASDLPPGGLLRFRADVAARIWPDPEDVRFAVEYGVPHARGLFRIAEGIARQDPAVPAEAFAREVELEPVDTPHGRLQPLGELYQADVLVRLDDGTIWVSDPDSEIEFELVNRDLSSLAYLVYMFEAERPEPGERPTPYDWADIGETIRGDITAWDALPFESGAQFWGTYLDSYPMM